MSAPWGRPVQRIAPGVAESREEHVLHAQGAEFGVGDGGDRVQGRVLRVLHHIPYVLDRGHRRLRLLEGVQDLGVVWRAIQEPTASSRTSA